MLNNEENLKAKIQACISTSERQDLADKLVELIRQQTARAELEGRIAELWNPRLRIPENEVVIRERIDELENNHANG